MPTLRYGVLHRLLLNIPYKRTHVGAKKGLRAYVDGVALPVSDSFTNYINDADDIALRDFIVGD